MRVTNVLLIDDESATRLIMQSRLKECGFRVAIADNGAQGLHMAREERYDLVLVDAALGSGVTGFEVCRRLKQTPQTAAIPVVLTSKQSSRDELARGYECGCEAFVLKSDLPVLDHILRVLLRYKHQQDELLTRMHSIEESSRRLLDDRQRSSDLEQASHSGGDHSVVWREMAAGRPDGLLIVDDDGIVRYADRGAHDLLGSGIEGRNLGRLAPHTGFEAFVRDTHNDKHEGFRFDVPLRNGRGGRSLLASVVPIVTPPGARDPGMRIVILLDIGRRRVGAELLRTQEYTLPRREIGVLLDAARQCFTSASLIGSSPAITRARAQVAEAAPSLEPVLLSGQPGTGRQHVARALHYGGESGGPFLALSCAGLSRDHLEAELFGQVKGAFPDAIVDRPGALQMGAHGTLFLEDIERMPRELQPKLLRALTEHVVSRAGADKPEAIETRVIASTSVRLDALVEAGEFDAELYQRLRATEMYLPPLRERAEDIPVLARHFLRVYGHGRAELDFSPEALQLMVAYEWPDNVRELRSCIERAVKLGEGDLIGAELLTAALRDTPPEVHENNHDLMPSPRANNAAHGTHLSTPGPARSLDPASPPRPRSWEIRDDDEVSLDLYEKKCLLRAIDQTHGDKLKAARLLKVGKSTLYRKLKKYAIV
jgi:DNA-binding NtrC family response regulator